MSSGRARSGGTRISAPARRKSRSWRKRFSRIAWRRSRCVAESTRTSTFTGCGPPTGRTSPLSSARRSLGCSERGKSPTSSSSRVPPEACWKRPTLSVTPVATPRSMPNSSASTSSFGKAEQLSGTKGPPARRERRWIRCASSSLPVPDSPTSMTGRSLTASRSTSCRSRCPVLEAVRKPVIDDWKGLFPAAPLAPPGGPGDGKWVRASGSPPARRAANSARAASARSSRPGGVPRCGAG